MCGGGSGGGRIFSGSKGNTNPTWGGGDYNPNFSNQGGPGWGSGGMPGYSYGRSPVNNGGWTGNNNSGGSNQPSWNPAYDALQSHQPPSGFIYDKSYNPEDNGGRYAYRGYDGVMRYPSSSNNRWDFDRHWRPGSSPAAPTPTAPPAPTPAANPQYWGDLEQQWTQFSADPRDFAPGTDMAQAKLNFMNAGGMNPTGSVMTNPYYDDTGVNYAPGPM
jgi:hypothetical protein